MALPTIASGVPHSIVPRQLTAADACLAKFLFDAGAIQERDVPDAWDSVLDVCKLGLDAWLKAELGELHCLNPSFCMTAVDGLDSSMQVYPRERKNGPIRYQGVDIRWFEQSERQWVIGPKLEAMEVAHAGLGQAVLEILQEKSCHVYPMFTPDQACYQATVMYWWGEDSEEVVLDMECSTPEEREAMRADMITRQELIDSFPAWAITFPTRQKQPEPSLQRLRDSIINPEFFAIADDALALVKLKNTKDYVPEYEGEYLGWGAVLAWREDDVSVRIFDDMVNYATEGEFYDHIGEMSIDFHSPKQLQAWQKAMRKRFAAIRLIDSLIYRLAERY